MSAEGGDVIINTGPEPTLGLGDFKIKAFLNGIPLGWFTDLGAPDHRFYPTPNENDATIWTQVTFNGYIYLRKAPNNYLSYSNSPINQYVLQTSYWAAAARWQLVDGKYLLCVDNGQLVGYDGGFFYANGKNVVSVAFHTIPFRKSA